MFGKNEIRREGKSARRSMGEDLRKQMSRVICGLLSESMKRTIPRGGKILFYSPFPDEVDILPLFHDLLGSGDYGFFFPKITSLKKALMEAVPVSIGSDLRQEDLHFGIFEPISGAYEDPKNLDLVLVPAVAVDYMGNRVGFGRGFYDRFLVRVSQKCKKWGVVFSGQVMELVETNAYDIPLDSIVSENGFLECEGRTQEGGC